MSFILDALRKSEHERKRGALPSVAQIPYALPRARLPAWVPVAIGALAVALVTTGFAWWYTARPAAEGRTERVAASTFAPQGGALSGETPPPWSAQAPEQRARAAAPSDASGEAAPPASPSNAPGEPAPPAASRTTAPVQAPDDALPTASALAAAGAAPPLTLHLLVYGEDAAKRFVIINNRTYHEGEFLAEGPQLVRISNRGAVLRQQGRDFLLLPE